MNRMLVFMIFIFLRTAMADPILKPLFDIRPMLLQKKMNLLMDSESQKNIDSRVLGDSGRKL